MAKNNPWHVGLTDLMEKANKPSRRAVKAKVVHKEDGSISPQSYLDFLYRWAGARGGCFLKSQLYEAVEAAFGPYFGAADLRIIRKPSFTYWKNQVDWAKTQATKGQAKDAKGEPLPPIMNKQMGNDTLFVLIEPDTPQELVDSLLVYKKPSYTRKCPACKKINPLSKTHCVRCAFTFPPKPKRRYVKPI